jgi:hypothetical protein
MALEITGKLFKILPEQTGSGKNGNWVKQEFVIETQEQYPKKVCCSAWGDKAATLKGLKPGDMLKVSVNLESREYNERWYTEARAWKIDVVAKAIRQLKKNTQATSLPLPPIAVEPTIYHSN